MNFDIGELASLTDFIKGSIYYHDHDDAFSRLNVFDCELIDLFDILNGIDIEKERSILHFDNNSAVTINRYKKYLELIK